MAARSIQEMAAIENGRKVSELQELLEVRRQSAVPETVKTVSCRYD